MRWEYSPVKSWNKPSRSIERDAHDDARYALTTRVRARRSAPSLKPADSRAIGSARTIRKSNSSTVATTADDSVSTSRIGPISKGTLEVFVVIDAANLATR